MPLMQVQVSVRVRVSVQQPREEASPPKELA